MEWQHQWLSATALGTSVGRLGEKNLVLLTAAPLTRVLWCLQCERLEAAGQVHRALAAAGGGRLLLQLPLLHQPGLLTGLHWPPLPNTH